MNKNKLIPELRFPEFKNEGEWDNEELRNLGEFFGGGTPERSNNDYWIGDIPWISSSDITEDDIHNISITRFINENAIKESATKIITKGSVLFVSRVGVGKLAINKKDVCTSQDFTNFLPQKNVLNFFIGYYFSSNKNLLQSLNQGTSIKGFSKSDLESFKLPYPKNLAEQQKIASCLSSLDEVIAAHSQKLELLKDHKKGLMQNLFPQEGEKVPKFRFKEFEKDGEWVEKQLGEVSKFVRGPFGGALKKEIFVSSGFAVYEQSHAIYSNLKEFRYFINEEKFQDLKRFAVNAGNLIMSCSGTMGKFAIIPQNFTRGVINQALLKLEIKKEFSVDFIKLILELPKNQEQILSQAGGGAIKNVASVSILQEIKIEIPKLKEQQKIASCLSSLDALITAQAEKIEQLKLHKKGLMQGLFPVKAGHALTE